jgi:hypothetical protein
VALHDCLPSAQPRLLGDGDTKTEIMYGEEKNILYEADQSSHGRIKNFLYRHGKPKEPAKEGPPSFVVHKSSFASVSTVIRGHPSLISLVPTDFSCSCCEINCFP